MRVLYALRKLAFFHYHEPVIRALCSQGHEVLVHTHHNSGGAPESDALHACLRDCPGLRAARLLRRTDFWRPALVGVRHLLTYSNYLAREGQSDFYLKRWEKGLPSSCRAITGSRLLRWLLTTRFAEMALRGMERWAPPGRAHFALLRNLRPDVVVASPGNQLSSEEIEYVKAARALGVPAAIAVHSWDNLSTKGVFSFAPDLLLAWNDLHRREAIAIHRIPEERVIVTGAPFFDKWISPIWECEPREPFCRRVGLDASQPFVLYLGSSQDVSGDESWLVKNFWQALGEHPVPAVRRTGLLVRSHPSNFEWLPAIRNEGIPAWPPEGGVLPDTGERGGEFHSSLHHCVAVVGVNTSAMIDAVISGRPCVAILSERYRATQEEACHFRQLLEADVLELARTPAEAAEIVRQLAQGNDRRQSQRRRFRAQFVRPRGLDIPAGNVTARAIELLGAKKSPAEIDRELGRLDASSLAAEPCLRSGPARAELHRVAA